MNGFVVLPTPKFKGNYFRPACCKIDKGERNFIIICCSPAYNGMWEVKGNNWDSYDTWNNNGLDCYEVPIADCRKVRELDNKDVMHDFGREIYNIQQKWWKGELKNGRAHKSDKQPDYFYKLENIYK